MCILRTYYIHTAYILRTYYVHTAYTNHAERNHRGSQPNVDAVRSRNPLAKYAERLESLESAERNLQNAEVYNSLKVAAKSR